MSVKCRHKCRFIRIVLTVIVLLGWGLYWLLVPHLRLRDARWRANHTETACWNEVKHAIARTGFRISVGYMDYVARYGDKKMFAEMLDSAKNNEELESSLLGNRAEVLAYIANHDCGSDLMGWKKWWGNNQTLTQCEWRRNGLKEHGLDLHDPLTKNDRWRLLHLANGRLSVGGHNNEVPRYVEWNAFRVLIDNGVSPGQLKKEIASSDDWTALLRFQSMWFMYEEVLRGGVGDQGSPIKE